MSVCVSCPRTFWSLRPTFASRTHPSPLGSRSLYLPPVHTRTRCPPLPAHTQAFATDSADQSPWMYYRWLLGNSLAHLEAAKQLPEGPRREQEAQEAALILGEVRAGARTKPCGVH
mgnify:CR=1 FL=1